MRYYYDKRNDCLLKIQEEDNISLDSLIPIEKETYNKVSEEGYVYRFNEETEELELELNKELRKDYFRKKREYIFRNGFEPYKSNVQYGIEIETEEQHQVVIEWYNNMLDIEKTEFALENIPERIKYYLRGAKNEIKA